MAILEDISLNLQRGKAKVVKELVQQAVDQGIDAKQKMCIRDRIESAEYILPKKHLSRPTGWGTIYL